MTPGPRGEPSENRVRLAPLFRSSHRALSPPWSTMTARPTQTLDVARVGADIEARRRCLPPRESLLLPWSQRRRWRERPHHCAQRLTPGPREGVVHAIGCRCPARPHVCPDRAEGSRRVRACREAQLSPHNRVATGNVIASVDHRANDAGAVLAVVNALRFASTRLVAGPRALTTPARGTVGRYAMVAELTKSPKGIDVTHRQA